MIQKFANSERNAGFCHVSRACACSFEIRHSIVRCRNFRPAIREKKPTHTIIYFWLCENGSSQSFLHFTMKTGLSRCSHLRDSGFRANRQNRWSHPCLHKRHRSVIDLELIRK